MIVLILALIFVVLLLISKYMSQEKTEDVIDSVVTEAPEQNIQEPVVADWEKQEVRIDPLEEAKVEENRTKVLNWLKEYDIRYSSPYSVIIEGYEDQYPGKVIVDVMWSNTYNNVNRHMARRHIIDPDNLTGDIFTMHGEEIEVPEFQIYSEEFGDDITTRWKAAAGGGNLYSPACKEGVVPINIGTPVHYWWGDGVRYDKFESEYENEYYPKFQEAVQNHPPGSHDCYVKDLNPRNEMGDATQL